RARQRSLWAVVRHGGAAGHGAAGVSGGHCPWLERDRAGVLVNCGRRPDVGAGGAGLVPSRSAAQGPASLRLLEWPASTGLAPSCVFCCCTPNRSWSHGDGDHPIGTVYLLLVGGAGGGNLAPPACPRDRSGT